MLTIVSLGTFAYVTGFIGSIFSNGSNDGYSIVFVIGIFGSLILFQRMIYLRYNQCYQMCNILFILSALISVKILMAKYHQLDYLKEHQIGSYIFLSIYIYLNMIEFRIRTQSLQNFYETRTLNYFETFFYLA